MDSRFLICLGCTASDIPICGSSATLFPPDGAVFAEPSDVVFALWFPHVSFFFAGRAVDFLKVARSLLIEWTWRERLLSLAARQIYRRNFPPVALSNQNQRYESTRQSSQIITRTRAKLFEYTTLALLFRSTTKNF